MDGGPVSLRLVCALKGQGSGMDGGALASLWPSTGWSRDSFPWALLEVGVSNCPDTAYFGLFSMSTTAFMAVQ